MNNFRSGSPVLASHLCVVDVVVEYPIIFHQLSSCELGWLVLLLIVVLCSMYYFSLS